MTFSAVPFALQNGSHSADLFRQAVSSFVPPGGGIVTTGDFAVTQTGTPSMGVLVGVGRLWIPGTNVGNVTGGNFSSQAMYYGQNDAPYVVSVPTSDPVNPRIDVVYATVKDSQYTGSLNSGSISIVSGAPSASPATPAIPANSLALAKITVPANASSIVNANIAAPSPVLRAINPNFGVLTEYPCIWTGVTDWGTGGGLFGEYTVRGNVVTVHARGTFGNAATLGNNVLKCPVPPGYPIAAGVFHMGGGQYVSAAGSIRTLTVFADGGQASVWIAGNPVLKPGDVPVSAAFNSFFDIEFSYKTSAV